MVKQRKKIRDIQSPPQGDVTIKYPAKVVWYDKVIGEMGKNGIIDFYDYRVGFDVMEKITSEGWGTKNLDERGNLINYFRLVKLGKAEDERMLKKSIAKASPFMKNPDDMDILTGTNTGKSQTLSIGFDIV